MQPAPYQIPTDGSCGKLIAAAGWHAWRPAHLHVKVSAPGHELLTAQLYFPGDPHNDDDIATRGEARADARPAGRAPTAPQTVTYDFVLDPANGAERLMLFHVRMDVHLPLDLDPRHAGRHSSAREKAYARSCSGPGKWPHIWRIVGEYANFSIFDVESNDELHQMLSGLPLFPYMDIHVTPLATHPSDVKAGQ